MKLQLFKSLAIATGVFFMGATANAQQTEKPMFKTWSIGLNAGILSPYSPFGGKEDFSNSLEGFGYGLYLKKQVTPYLSFRLDGLRGTLKADNATPYNDGSISNGPFSSFNTQINYSASLSAVINMFNWSMFKQQNGAQIYALAGGGFTHYTTTTTTTGNVTATNAETNSLVVPVGAGIKFRLSQGVNLDLGATVNFVDAGDVNGYATNGNDRYTYVHGGLEFALGKGQQLAFFSPTAATYDEAVAAKNVANALKSDLDAQKAENAKLRAEMNTLAADLLRDTDGDGVADKLDKCAGTPAGTVVDGAGCPLKVPAPQITERVIITEADRKVVADAIANLEFDLGKATIRAKSYTTLNKVAALLVEKNFSLKLAGHTDNTGSDQLNMRLSKDRAESVKAYLVSQGANASRIEAIGFGEGQPISTNNTPEGRQENRRVEFTLY
ncbi:MAG: OmpA family protein [Bacteroidia bacterium]